MNVEADYTQELVLIRNSPFPAATSTVQHHYTLLLPSDRTVILEVTGTIIWTFRL
jgi:hypothetical protein